MREPHMETTTHKKGRQELTEELQNKKNMYTYNCVVYHTEKISMSMYVHVAIDMSTWNCYMIF